MCLGGSEPGWQSVAPGERPGLPASQLPHFLLLFSKLCLSETVRVYSYFRKTQQSSRVPSLQLSKPFFLPQVGQQGTDRGGAWHEAVLAARFSKKVVAVGVLLSTLLECAEGLWHRTGHSW